MYADYEGLVPRLETLKKEHEEDLATAADLERRIGNVLRQYTTRVSTITTHNVNQDCKSKCFHVFFL